MRRRILIALLATVALAAGGALWVRSYLAGPLNVPAGGYWLQIAPGTSWSAIARQLGDDGIADWAWLLRACGQLTGQAGRIQAGEYQLTRGTTPATLLQQLVSGRVVLHKFTLVEGWTVGDILQAMKSEPAIVKTLTASRADTRAPNVADDLARELDLAWTSAEGAFLPETYLYARGTTDRAMLLRAYGALKSELDEAWAKRRRDLPLADPYQLLILASIVERETALSAERPLIAGVFIRRLELGMRLQTDPSVIYGLGTAFDGNLTRANLEADTPWNTYTRDGLPPTPIAAPSKQALAATAQPAEGEALFFVASAKGDGSHQFTATLREHEAAVRDYLAAPNRGKGN